MLLQWGPRSFLETIPQVSQSQMQMLFSNQTDRLFDSNFENFLNG